MIPKAVHDDAVLQAVRQAAEIITQLAAALRDEEDLREGPEVNQTLLQLVREAYEVFTTTTGGVDLRDWIRAAEPFVKK